MDHQQLFKLVSHIWDSEIVPQLQEYILIPNKSPIFDADWQANGHMEKAVDLMTAWCSAQPIPGMTISVERLPGRTPLIFIDIPSNANGDINHNVVLYGHFDKQPEMTGWRENLGPWKPVIEEDRLYGRGGADDGYAIYASLVSVMALHEQNIPHGNLKIIIEASEESGSPDLPAYIEALRDRIGEPDLIICLDSGCGNYEQLWCTTSLRGMVGGNLRVDVLDEGMHSGDASGIVPSSFRILRQLISRIENEQTGQVLGEAFEADIPEQRQQQATEVAKVLAQEVYDKFPFANSTQPINSDLDQLVLNRTWRPALEVTGIEGAPGLNDAGNVMRPFTAAKISLRIPPTCDAQTAKDELEKQLTTNPPYKASIEFTANELGDGWHAPPMEDWLEQSVQNSSQNVFGKNAMFMGEGGSIPFMGMLGELFPKAQFLITGVLGPHSNAHGPNEFLHIPTGKKITACVSHTLADHFKHVTS